MPILLQLHRFEVGFNTTHGGDEHLCPRQDGIDIVDIAADPGKLGTDNPGRCKRICPSLSAISLAWASEIFLLSVQ